MSGNRGFFSQLVNKGINKAVEWQQKNEAKSTGSQGSFSGQSSVNTSAWNSTATLAVLQSAEPYMYSSLPLAPSFRLLRLSKIAPQTNCSLETFLLNDHPSFHALSYTWGPPLNTEECIFNYGAPEKWILKTPDGPRSIEINKNLREALEAIVKLGTVAYLWVDALCINQLDLEERSRQVGSMDKIFSRAQKVIIWLSKDVSNAEDFFWIHRTLSTAWEQYAMKNGGWRALQIPDWSDLMIQQRLGITVPPEKWQAYADFYEQREWFRRSWVAQEVALARDISIYCGQYELSWNPMVFIANVVRSTGIGVEKAVLRRTGIPQSLGYEVYALQFLRSQIVIGGPEEPPDDERPTLEETNGATTPLERCWAYFENTIAVIRGLAVQDQRDKIYCVLGMAGRFMPGGSNAIMKPDYTKHVEDVYIEVTMILMNNLPCLTTLGLVEDESLRLIPSLPSWVPDFSSRVSRNYLNIVMGRNNFNASRSTNRISYPRILNSQTLTLRGAPFDLVTALCATRMDIRVDHRLPQMTAVLRNIEFVRSILTICSDPVPLSSAYGATSFDIIRIALVPQSPQRRTDAQFGGIHAHDWFLMALSTGIGWLSELNTSLRACFTLLDGLRTGPSSPADSTHVTFPTLDRIRSYAQLLMTQPEQRDAQFWANAGQVETNAKAYDAQFGYLHVDRRLFRTANGFVGVGPLSIQPGDQIWVIQDSKFPFILRPVERAEKERAFKVVGECYVHGFMNGEMLDAGVGEMGDVHLV